MSLPLESQTEYPLAVEVPTYSVNKCNWCIIAKDMPDLFPKNESSATSMIKTAAKDPSSVLPKVTPHLQLFIILVFMMILYVIIVGYIASYKPHTEVRGNP